MLDDHTTETVCKVIGGLSTQKCYNPLKNMARWTTFISTVILLLLGHSSEGQISSIPIDTVKIYKNKTGIRYKNYIHHWFFISNHEVGWNPKRENKQDSLVIYDHPPRYFKVYNFNNKLILEGQTVGWLELQGEIKFYYKSGRIKRIEYWSNELHNDSCISAVFHDAPGPERTWKFFRRDGTIKKIYEHKIKIYSCVPEKFELVRLTTRIKRNGKTKSIRIEKAE